MNKEAIGIVLDGRLSSLDSLLYNQHLNSVCSILHRAAIESRKSDLTGVVVVGTETTENPMNLAHLRLYKPAFKGSVDYLAGWQREIRDEALMGGCGDLLDGIIQCGDAMTGAMGNGKFSAALIYVFTSKKQLEEMNTADSEGITEVSAKLDEEGIEVLFLVDGNIDHNVKAPFGDLLTEQEFREEFKFPLKRTRPTTVFKGMLRIGNHEVAEVKMYSKTHVTPLPRGKWDSGGDRSTGYYADASTSEAVPESRLVKAYKYGPDYIPFAAIDEAELKSAGKGGHEKSLDILGFGPRKSLDRSAFLSVVYVVYPEEGSETGFLSLVNGMMEKDRVGLARWVRNSNADPKILYLIPFQTGLYAVLGAFSEDHRKWTFPSLALSSHESMEEYVDRFSCSQFAVPHNPIFQRLQMAIQQRAVNGAAAEIPGVPGDLAAALIPIVSTTDPALARIGHSLQTQLPLSAQDSSVWHRTTLTDILPRFWDASKPSEGDGDDPLPKFNQMVNDTTQDRVPEAFLFLMSRIPALTAKHEFELAGRCLKRLREVSIRESQSIRFNAFINELGRRARQATSGDGPARRLWAEQVVPGHIGLICNTEDSNSPVTPDEASEFLSMT